MSSIAGYNVKEEVTEVKKNLFESRDTFLMLVVAGVVGGAITRFIIPKSITEGSVFSRFRSWFGYGQEEEEEHHLDRYHKVRQVAFGQDCHIEGAGGEVADYPAATGVQVVDHILGCVEQVQHIEVSGITTVDRALELNLPGGVQIRLVVWRSRLLRG